MEKFQMLFPYSATGSSAIINTHNGFEEVDHHHHLNSSSANNFMGLKIDSLYHHDDLSSLVPNNNNNNNDQLMMSSSEIGSMELVENEKQITKGTKKLGDQKKIRKARYAFQTRSQVDILDDGYRWRKYGQKAVKNNKFPRSYYRCTYQGCSVKKQVQRLTKHEGVVVTTYEGTHSHPIQTPTDNFEHILNQMQIYTPF